MTTKAFETSEVPKLANVLTRMVEENCPKCILGPIYKVDDISNAILDKKVVRINPCMGYICGIWDGDLRGCMFPYEVPMNRPELQGNATSMQILGGNNML